MRDLGRAARRVEVVPDTTGEGGANHEGGLASGHDGGCGWDVWFVVVVAVVEKRRCGVASDGEWDDEWEVGSNWDLRDAKRRGRCPSYGIYAALYRPWPMANLRVRE